MEALLKSMGESQMRLETKAAAGLRKEPVRYFQTREESKKKENFFNMLCSEILTIPNVPWVKAEGVEGSDFKTKMVEYMTIEQEEKKEAAERDNARGFTIKGPNEKYDWTREYGISDFEEQVNDHLETIEGLLLTDKKPVYDSFGFERGKCKSCPTTKCAYYEASNCIINRPGSDIFSCLNCGCPMNSHRLVRDRSYFSNDLADLIMRKRLTSEQLNFRGFVTILTIPVANAEELRLGKLSQILNEGGFHMLSYYKTPTENLFNKLLQREIMQSQNLLDKSDYEAFSEFLGNDEFLEDFVYWKDYMLGNPKEKSFLRLKRKRNLGTSKLAENGSKLNWSKISNNQDIEKSDDSEIPENISEVLLSIVKRIENAFRGKESTMSFVLSLVSKEDSGFKDFRRFLVAVADYLPPSLGLFYQSETKYECMLDNQVFFPDFFRLHVETLLILPDDRMNPSKAQDKMKDAYDFNSCTLIKSLFGSVKANALLTTLSRFMKNASFLISNLMAENQLTINICASLGSPIFINMGSDSSPNFYKFTEYEHNRMIFKDIAPELFENQRVLLVMRPSIVKSGINELILNIFRINNFTVIKRTYCVLTKSEAVFMAHIEKIHQDNQGSYIDMMTDGPCELVLVSKFGAFAEAKVICDGCLTGIRNTSFTRNVLAGDLFLEHPMKNTKIKEVMKKNHFNVLENLFSMNQFRGVREMMKLEELILETSMASMKSEKQDKFFINEQTKEVYYEKFSKTSNLKGTHSNIAKISKENHLLKIIQNECFNFFTFPSPDETVTEELVSIFMPDCSKITLLFLILKPNRPVVIESVKDMLVHLKFNLVYQEKRILVEKEVELLLKSLFHNHSEALFADNRAKFLDYWMREIEIVGIVKPGCRKEMLSILRNFRLMNLISEDGLEPPLKKEDLAKLVVPCWNNESHELALSLINMDLLDIEASKFQILDNKTKESIIDFILLNTFGDSLAGSLDFVQIKVESFLDMGDHIHYKVKTNRLGEFEIRIFEFASFAEEFSLEILNKICFEYQIIGWYYNFINSKLLQRCPVSYQFRIYPEVGLNFVTPRHIYDCQQYVGNVFVEEIIQQMIMSHSKFSDQEKFDGLSASMGLNSADRGSVIAYLWGMKLAQFIKKLEALNDETIPGWGQIILYENSLKGAQFSQTVEHMQAEFDLNQNRKEEIFKYMNEYTTKEDDGNERMENIKRVITKNLEIIFKSKTYAFARDISQRRILPSHLDTSNIRILADKEAIFNQILHQDFKTIMFDYELLANDNTARNRDIPTFNDYCLVHVLPELKSKYSLVANIKYLLEIELTNLPEKAEEIKSRTYTSMKRDSSEDERIKSLVAIKDAFNRIYTMDIEDQDFLQSLYKETITEERFIRKQIPDFIEMEIFFICLQECCRHIRYINFCNEEIKKLSEQNRKKENEYKKKRQEETSNNEQINHLNLLAARAKEEFEKQRTELVAKKDVVKSRVKILLEKIETRNIFYSYEDQFFKKEHSQNNKIKIPREKYFKPFVEEQWEPNLEDERFRKDLFAGLDRAEGHRRFKDAVIFDVFEKDVVQQAWYRDTPLEVLNLRPMKKEKKDGVIVEKVIPRAEKLQMEAIDEEIRKFQEYMKKINMQE